MSRGLLVHRVLPEFRDPQVNKVSKGHLVLQESQARQVLLVLPGSQVLRVRREHKVLPESRALLGPPVYQVRQVLRARQVL